MKKSALPAYIILGTVFLLFCVIAVAVPTVKTVSFWVAFAFTAIAFVAQIIIWKKAFGHSDTLKSKFLGLPLIHIGIVYLIIQLISFAVFMAFPQLAVWIPIVTCTLILGISVVCSVSAEVGKSEVVRVEEKNQSKVNFINGLQTEVELIADAETDGETKLALQSLAEKIRFSDPVSSGELSELENQIMGSIDMLKNSSNKNLKVKEIDLLLDARNKKCKTLK